MLPVRSTLNLLTPPACRSQSLLVGSLAVLAAFTLNAVKTVEAVPAHVWLIVTGASDVSVPELSHEFRDTRLLIDAAVSQINV